MGGREFRSVGKQGEGSVRGRQGAQVGSRAGEVFLEVLELVGQGGEQAGRRAGSGP
jgi:hypothetical protein